MVPFSLVVLNHEQVKSSTTGSIVTCEKGDFKAITNHILSADVDSMETMIQKSSKGSQFDLSSASEKKCLDMINNHPGFSHLLPWTRTILSAFIMALKTLQSFPRYLKRRNMPN